MKKTIANIVIATLGTVCIAVFTQATPSEKSKVLSEPFGFRCAGPDFRTTLDGCAEKLVEKCPGGVHILYVTHSKPEETPALIEGVAACGIEPI
jgi:hypothetical protein